MSDVKSLRTFVSSSSNHSLNPRDDGDGDLRQPRGPGAQEVESAGRGDGSQPLHAGERRQEKNIQDSLQHKCQV